MKNKHEGALFEALKGSLKEAVESKECAPERAENGQLSESENGGKTARNGQNPPPVEHQFKPGHPGGPGRPKGPASIKKILRKWVFKDYRDDTIKMLSKLFDLALEGNLTAIRLIMEHSKPDKKPR